MADLSPAGGTRDCVFWRQKEQTFTKHRNPLLCVEAGVSLENFAVDWLHCISQGLIPFLSGYILHELIAADAFDHKAPAGMRDELAVTKVKQLLFSWYRDEHKAGRKHTKVQALTKGMLTFNGEPYLGLHGSESNGFLLFVRDVLLPSFGLRLGPRLRPYQDATTSLCTMLEICRAPRGKLSTSLIASFCNSVKIHLRAIQRLQLPERPKHHQAAEMGAMLFSEPSMNVKSIQCWFVFC